MTSSSQILDRLPITLINFSYLFFPIIDTKPFISENNGSTENVESDKDFYFQYKPEEMSTFPLETDLESHKSTSHPGNFQYKPEEMSHLFTCDKCDSLFSLEKDLESHKSTSHPGNFQYKPEKMSTFPLEMDLESHKSTTHDTVS